MFRFALLVLLATPAFARSLEWRAVDVKARLERDGSLRVRERLDLVFDGDWNGGERIFRTNNKQWIELHGVTRIENGREIALERGSLDALDHYDFVKTNVLRWRSRLPSDPEFANRELVYVVDYTAHNIVEPAGERQFRLNHDFGLPVRTSNIERYTLQLDFDPAWNTLPVSQTLTDVPEGESTVVTRTLITSAEVAPADVERAVPWWLGWTALAFYAAGAWFLITRFIAAERETGRFDPIVARFDESVLALKPEVAGVAWDCETGPAEVAATLARMAQEKKITTRADGTTLHMHLNVPQSTLEGHEKLLVEKLFFDGDDTDTDRVKTHYRSTGFNPAAVIQPRMDWELSQIPGWSLPRKRASWVRHAVLLPLCAFALFIAGLAGHADDLGIAMGTGFYGLILGGIASIVAWRYSTEMADFRRAFTGPALCLLIPLGIYATAAVQAHRNGMGIPILFAIPIWYLAILHLVLDLLKIRDAPEIIALRRRVAGVRKFFMEELQKPEPDLRDEWFPYILAFGLGTHVDQWFRAFGDAPSSSSYSSYSSSSSYSSASSGWTGGGGAFGGAGATGSWALAAGAIAAGVSPPSSSGGGGGDGGGGGSSSGGGGGGGW